VRLLRYTLRRLLMLIPVLLGVSIFTFVLIRVLPGDPIRTLLPQTATPADIAAARARYGLDHPIFTQYWIFLKGLVHGNLGTSFQTGAPVTRELSQRLGPTFELVTCSLVLALVIGVTLGLVSALRRGGVWDQVVRFGSIAGGAVSEFWLALLLILLFYYHLGLAPAPNGRINSGIQLHTITHIDVVDAIVTGNLTALRSVLAHLALPVITLTLVSSAPIVRSVRASALQVLASDAYRCTEAHGLPAGMRVSRYVVRESLVGVPTLAAIIYGYLLGGAVLVEYVYSWQGFGQWALHGMLFRDYPIVQAFVLVSAAFYVLVFLVADVLHAVLDPRVRL
jgi:peptide/nickel transport system permease protein